MFTRVHFGSKYSKRPSCMYFCLSSGKQSSFPSTPLFSFHSIKVMLRFMGKKERKRLKNTQPNSWVAVSPATVISMYWLSLISLSLQPVHWRSRCYQTCRKLIWDCWDAFFPPCGRPSCQACDGAGRDDTMSELKDPGAGGWCHGSLSVLLLAPAKRITLGSRGKETLALTSRYGRKELQGMHSPEDWFGTSGCMGAASWKMRQLHLFTPEIPLE